jgi:internalin A
LENLKPLRCGVLPPLTLHLPARPAPFFTNHTTPTMTELARHLIEREKRERTGYLDIGNCGLTELPDLSELDWLETLIVSSWVDFEKRQIVHNRNLGKPNRIAATPTNALPKSLKKVILGGDYQTKSGISDWSFLGNLTNLTTLYLRDNQISDGSFLGKLINLTSLHLTSNQISNWSFLEKLSNLTTLDLCLNQIKDGSFLEKLTRLAKLDLSSNQIKDGSFWGNLANLTLLDLSSNQIRDGSFLENLANLTLLDLRFNQISDAAFLGNLTNLTTLYLRRNQISNGSFLERLTNLTTLDLSSNQIRDGSFLENLTNLTTLDLSSNQISDAAFLGNLTNLTTLDISENQVEDLSSVLHLVKKGIPIFWDSWPWNPIKVQGNPLSNPPRATVEQGNAAILEYFRLKETQGARPLLEAKLVLLGDGRAGKTSLALP